MHWKQLNSFFSFLSESKWNWSVHVFYFHPYRSVMQCLTPTQSKLLQMLTDSCPPWFVLSNNSAGNGYSPCECNEDFGDVIICDEKLQKSYLLLNFCMTFNSSSSDEQESDAISFGLSHSTILCEPSSRASMWFALQYLSAFYLLLLIALTYACVELHGHNFRPIVWLWKPVLF